MSQSFGNGAGAQIVAAFIAAPPLWEIVKVFWKRLRRPDARFEAEARKINAEADETIANVLYREIERIDNELKEVRAELVTVRKAAIDEKRDLEAKNRLLRDRVKNLETKLELQQQEFDDKLADEREECAKKLSEMEGHIRQLRQRQESYGNLTRDKPLAGPLHTAFRPGDPDKDGDLIDKLNEVPSAKRVSP